MLRAWIELPARGSSPIPLRHLVHASQLVRRGLPSSRPLISISQDHARRAGKIDNSVLPWPAAALWDVDGSVVTNSLADPRKPAMTSALTGAWTLRQFAYAVSGTRKLT